MLSDYIDAADEERKRRMENPDKEIAALRQRVEECEREHPPEPEYTAWCEAGKPDVTALRQRVEELEAQLAHLRSEEPCPRCGYGVTGDCFGCKLKASEAKLVEVGRICGMSVTEDPLMAVRRVADQHDRVMAQRDTAEAKLREKDERIEDLIEGGVALQAKLARCVEALEFLLLPIRPLLSDEPHERRIPTQHDALVIRQARAALAEAKGGE